MLLSSTLPTYSVPVRASAGASSSSSRSAAGDKAAPHLLRAAELADSSAGLTAPHPNFGCVIAHGPRVVGEGFLYAEGTTSAEVQAVAKARDGAQGAVAYLNMEPGDCHGDDSAISAIKQAKVSRVVVGLRHPLGHLRGRAINAMRGAGIAVDVLGEDFMTRDGEHIQEALRACREVNAPLLCRAVHQVPLSTLKYAMTLDGKIAASSGHASWISGTESRKQVFKTRARSDAVIVGGNTVRRDNPRLTTRVEGGHIPARIVMSRTLSLPDDLHLWDVTTGPTIVMTQTGARPEFQARLQARGVEIVEFDFLTPRAVVQHCYDRGFLSVLWECGGTLSAPAIAAGVVHKVLAFVAPKIIGGAFAPSPVGELGMVEMTQALNLSDVEFEKSGADMLIKGYLKRIPDVCPPPLDLSIPSDFNSSILSAQSRPLVINFDKSWEPYGALSNYTPHPISMPDGEGKNYVWKSVEHYYQAQRFFGVRDSLASDTVEKIQRASSPEEAARIGRHLTNERPDLIRPDWDSMHLVYLYNALRAKFMSYPSLQNMLLSTEGAVLVGAPSSVKGYPAALAAANGQKTNDLGFLLMNLRSEMLAETRRISAFGPSLAA